MHIYCVSLHVAFIRLDKGLYTVSYSPFVIREPWIFLP